MMRLSKTILFISILFFASCSSIRSGRYISLTRNMTTKELEQLFNVPAWKISEFNPGKKFVKGQRIFLPYSGGILNSQLNGRTLASIDYRAMRTNSRFMWPVPSSKRVSSHFGHRWGRKHEGMDIPAKKGSHIIAADSGVVVYSGRGLGGYGNITVLAHDDGFFTVYAHAHRNYTSKGQKVVKGQVIALVGNTGRSTGSHLHFEIRRESQAFNPKKFFNL